MIVLGVHGGVTLQDESEAPRFPSHDSAAVLVQDGEIIAAIEEERLDRIKHSNCFPARAIRYCLTRAGIPLERVDVIATNASRQAATLAAGATAIEDPQSEIFTDGRDFVGALFRRAFGIDVRDKLYFCNHHIAHAWSAYVPSGFDRSLILSIDGGGDNSSGMVLVGENRQIACLRQFSLNESLGHLYLHLGKMLAYTRFDEYKVMGLAPYGDPQTYVALLRACRDLLPEGNYRLAKNHVWFAHLARAGLVAGARRRSAPFTQSHKDFAAALQALLEEIVLHVVSYYRASTGQTSLCLAGGVVHNCSLNGRILNSGLFERVFAQPAAHDAGGALGAAWNAYYERNPQAPLRAFTHVYFGPDAGDDDSIARALSAWGDLLSVERLEDVASTAAELIANGAVIGWVQGRSEFGPRALGNRSILADPRPAENKVRINGMVKKRESFRPFAPSVLEEEAARFFEIDSAATLPFMIFVVNVRDEWHSTLRAITHVDGTARVQTVSRSTNHRYWQLIHEFGKLTGIPILLNTSFNNNAEPIVDSIDDAVICFLTSGLDVLVAGDCLVRKRVPVATERGFGALVPDLLPSRRLVKRKTVEGEFAYELLSIKSREFGTAIVPISRDVFALLERVDGRASLDRLAADAGIESQERRDALLAEIFELWTQRVIALRPLGQADETVTSEKPLNHQEAEQAVGS